MHKYLPVQFVLLLICTVAFAQKTRSFELPVPTHKITNSQYNSIRLVDSRPDTTGFGIVKVGGFDRNAKVVAKQSFSTQIANVFNALVDEGASKNELLLQLRQYSYAEVNSGLLEKGYCYLKLMLYSGNNGRYQKLSSLDTVVYLKSVINVTDTILKRGGEMVVGFISNNIPKGTVSGTSYTYRDVVRIDSVEKHGFKIYNTPVFVDGLYFNYKSFRDQTPDKQFVLEGNDINVSGAIKAADANGKLQKVKSKNLYAIVFMGHPYIAATDIYYPLKRENDELLFTGKAFAPPSAIDVITANMFLGMLGGLMFVNNESTFEMKIDHMSGTFIKIKEIEDPNMKYQDN